MSLPDNESLARLRSLDRWVDAMAKWTFLALGALMLGVATVETDQAHYLNAGNHAFMGAVWVFFLGLRLVWVRLGFNRGRTEAVEHAREARDAGLDLNEWIMYELEWPRPIGSPELEDHIDSWLRNPDD